MVTNDRTFFTMHFLNAEIGLRIAELWHRISQNYYQATTDSSENLTECPETSVILQKKRQTV